MNDVPKAMAPVQGRLFLAYQIDLLRSQRFTRSCPALATADLLRREDL